VDAGIVLSWIGCSTVQEAESDDAELVMTKLIIACWLCVCV